MEGNTRPAAFDAAIVELRGALLKFAKILVGDRDRAEDLVSDALVKAMTNYHQYKEGTNLRGWLFTILRNNLFTQHRKRGREVSDPDGIFASLVPVNEWQSWAVDLKVIRKRMRMLSPDHRRMVEMIAILGHDYEETAADLGVSVGTVKSGLSRARHYLETGEELQQIEQIDLPVEDEIAGADQIERLYLAGRSVSEIKEAVSGATRSQIMQVILDRNLSAKRS